MQNITLTREELRNLMADTADVTVLFREIAGGLPVAGSERTAEAITTVLPKIRTAREEFVASNEDTDEPTTLTVADYVLDATIESEVVG